MPLSHVPHIHDIQAGIDKRRNLTLQEITHDLAGRGGFEIVIAHGRGGIGNDDRKTGCGKVQRNLFRHELGAFVGPVHFLQ